VYSASKLVHLAPLVSVVAVGLMLNNAHLLANFPRFAKVMTKSLYVEIVAFKQLTVEITFVARTFFFLLLGYATAVESLAVYEAWIVMAVIIGVVFVARKVLLKVLYDRDTSTLFWFAPRGLITILLYLSIPAPLRVDNFPDGALMLTVLATTLILTVGLMRSQRNPD
jgi:cell volume regulation protein A